MADNSSFSPVIISTSTLEMRMGQDAIENLRRRLAQFVSIAGSGMFDLQIQNADFIKAISISPLVDDTRKYMRAVVQHYAEKEEVLKMMNNLAAAIERKETIEEKQDIQSALRFIFDLLNDQKNKNRVLDIMNTFSVDLLNYVKMDSANTIAAIYRYFYTVQLADSKWREILEGIFDVGDYLCCGVSIGKGSYGKVLKGFHKETGGIVAVKQIDLFDKSPRVIEALNRESKMLKYMNHPNIIRLYDAVKDHRRMYFVMEYCPMGDLDEWIRDQYATHQSIQLAVIVHLMKGITNALKFLRSQNIVHRDLKPQNILLTQENGELQPKLIDFTSAREVNEGQMLKSIWGTPLYMAPEVLSGRPYSEKADLWSLGVILYKLLFAALPFNANTPQDLVKNINTKKLYIPPNQLPPEVLSLLESLLQVDYQKRITWSDFFCHPFFACAEKNRNSTPRSKDQIEALFAENQELEMLLSKYKETATNYEEIITKLKLEVFNLMSGNSDLKEKIEVHHHNEKKYQEDREHLMNRIVQLERENGELVQEKLAHKADDDLVKLIEKDLRNKTKQFEEEKQLLTQNHNAIFTKMKEELETTKKENKILKEQEKDNRGLNDVIEALSAELASVENTMNNLYSEKEIISKEKDEFAAANIALKADLQRYIKKAHELDGSISSGANQKTKQLEDQLASLGVEVKRLNTIIDTVGIQLEQAQKERNKFEDELTAALERGRQKEVETDELMHAVDELEVRVKKLEADKKRLEEELKTAHTNLHDILSSFTQNNN
jgi:serine/threonine protein kinase